jgi:hypothetical protein
LDLSHRTVSCTSANDTACTTARSGQIKGSGTRRLSAEGYDDLAYVTKDQAETSVLFELIGARYERRSLLVTANQPFGEWNKIFPDQAMTLAAVNRLVHHSTTPPFWK